jgi:ribosomal protein S18 acetylase RimI-like enzyme
MFVDLATAARIDAAEVHLSIAVAEAARRPGGPGHVARLGRGAAVFVRPGSPINKVIGVALDEDLDEPALAGVEAAWAARGEAVRVELASLADPAAAVRLGARGYRVHGFEHVLVRRLDPADARREPPDLVVDHDPAAWLTALVDGFSVPDGTGAVADDYGREAIAAVMQDFAGAPDLACYVARRDGVVVGAATMQVHAGVALLCGASTLPAARRRGVQAALLGARLRDAARAGCDVATVTTAPGSQSQHNVTRQGFALAYVRAILVRALEPA